MPLKRIAAGGEPAAGQTDAGVASISAQHYTTPKSLFLLCDVLCRGIQPC